KLGLHKARGLVNAVLRRCQRELPQLEDGVPDQPAIHHSHPDWLVQRLRKDWSDQTDAILRANNTPAPMHLRVNRRRNKRDDYLAELAAAGIDASAPQGLADAVTLAEPLPTAALPGFADGCVSVQDV